MGNDSLGSLSTTISPSSRSHLLCSSKHTNPSSSLAIAADQTLSKTNKLSLSQNKFNVSSKHIQIYQILAIIVIYHYTLQLFIGCNIFLINDCYLSYYLPNLVFQLLNGCSCQLSGNHHLTARCIDMAIIRLLLYNSIMTPPINPSVIRQVNLSRDHLVSACSIRGFSPKLSLIIKNQYINTKTTIAKYQTRNVKQSRINNKQQKDQQAMKWDGNSRTRINM